MAEKGTIRRSKGTPRENARHVMLAGFIVFLILSAVIPGLRLGWEWVRMPEIPITAEFDLEHGEHGVYVIYEPQPGWPVRARFYVQTRRPDGTVMETYPSSQEWAYSPDTVRRVRWQWDAWIEQGFDVPDYPFLLCLRYEGRGLFGTPFDTPYQCNGPYSGRPARN